MMEKTRGSNRTKRFSLALLVCLMMAAVAAWGLRAKATAAVGAVPKQDADDYYLIATADDMAAFRDAVNAGRYNINAKLTADIDLGGTAANQWTPIGDSADKTAQFSGVFDGQGFEVSGLYISGDLTCQGLFGYIAKQDGSAPEVKNLAVSGHVSGNSWLGGIVGQNIGIVTHSAAYCGTITGTPDGKVGGIVGLNDGTAANCASNSSTISGTDRGGVIGSNTNANTVTNCGWFVDGAALGIAIGDGSADVVVSYDAAETLTSAWTL